MIRYINRIYRKMESFLENFSYSMWNLGMTVETYRYPDKKADVYGGYYGALRLKPKSNRSRHKCEICFTCEKICPNNAIELITFQKAKDDNILLSFRHNLSYCTNCGLCVSSCEYDAIEFNKDYGMVFSKKDELVVDILKRFRDKPL